MGIQEYLKEKGIQDGIINKEDHCADWITISKLIEGYVEMSSFLHQKLNENKYCTCAKSELEKDSLFPIYCRDCKSYVQTIP